MIRRISGEGALLLGGGHAILMQLAHPFVTAGVDDHSNFQSEILSRLYRTGLFMHNLVFADRHAARNSLQHFHDMHHRIRGRLRQRAGNFPSDMSYSGNDSQAKLWVHATFVDTGMKVYEKFVKPLSREERRNYYSDSLILAQLLGIPDRILPQTLEEFSYYMKGMLSGDTLVVTDTARRLAHDVLHPRVEWLPAMSAGLLRFVTAGLLNERFRHDYGLKWVRRQQRLLDGFSGSVRFLRPIVPSWVWQSPFLGGEEFMGWVF